MLTSQPKKDKYGAIRTTSIHSLIDRDDSMIETIEKKGKKRGGGEEEVVDTMAIKPELF